jgi:hypothetical protein
MLRLFLVFLSSTVQMRGSALNWAMIASFNIVSNSLFTNPIILHYNYNLSIWKLRLVNYEQMQSSYI